MNLTTNKPETWALALYSCANVLTASRQIAMAHYSYKIAEKQSVLRENYKFYIAPLSHGPSPTHWLTTYCRVSTYM